MIVLDFSCSKDGPITSLCFWVDLLVLNQIFLLVLLECPIIKCHDIFISAKAGWTGQQTCTPLKTSFQILKLSVIVIFKGWRISGSVAAQKYYHPTWLPNNNKGFFFVAILTCLQWWPVSQSGKNSMKICHSYEAWPKNCPFQQPNWEEIKRRLPQRKYVIPSLKILCIVENLIQW